MHEHTLARGDVRRKHDRAVGSNVFASHLILLVQQSTDQDVRMRAGGLPQGPDVCTAASQNCCICVWSAPASVKQRTCTHGAPLPTFGRHSCVTAVSQKKPDPQSRSDMQPSVQMMWQCPGHKALSTQVISSWAAGFCSCGLRWMPCSQIAFTGETSTRLCVRACMSRDRIHVQAYDKCCDEGPEPMQAA